MVKTLRGAFRAVTGAEAGVRGMTYGADMGLLAGVGRIPTVLFGPGDVRTAHRPDERVSVSDLERCARTLVVSALRYCGLDDSEDAGDHGDRRDAGDGRDAGAERACGR